MRDLTPTASPVLLSTHPIGASDFQDTRVVLHLAGDSSVLDYGPVRCGDDSRIRAYQDHDGPTHLVIGRHADAAALQRAAIRMGVDVEDLQLFQAGGI